MRRVVRLFHELILKDTVERVVRNITKQGSAGFGVSLHNDSVIRVGLKDSKRINSIRV